MGQSGRDHALRNVVCEAHREWLRLRTVPASGILPAGNRPPRILQADGLPFPTSIAPKRAQAHMTGKDAVEAMRRALNNLRGVRVLRLVCSPSCQSGELCHGDNLGLKL